MGVITVIPERFPELYKPTQDNPGGKTVSKTAALELKNISKSFGSVVANKNVDLTLYKGEILALLGENGSGKTTLMNMIAGIYYPDEGQIFVDGKEAVISSPKDAFGYGIGMIHQHFKLVDVFSASENIILGVKDGRKFNIKNVNATVGEICRKYGFNIDPKKKIYEMSVSEKQTVEIIKVIYRGAEILILDEPTAVLTPQESGKLFDILRKMREDGKSIIIITHKLHEVLSISDRVAVLRRGEHIRRNKRVGAYRDDGRQKGHAEYRKKRAGQSASPSQRQGRHRYRCRRDQGA